MKKVLFLISMVFAMAGVSHAQLLDMGIKLSYSSKDPQDIINNVQDQVSDFSNSTELLKQCQAGLIFRIHLGNHLYVQPEANFGLNSVWDSVEAQTNILDRISTGFGQIKSVNLNVPVLLGLKLLDLDGILNLRVFAGPEFYTSINGLSAGSFDFQTWSAIGGVGVDLLNFLTVDARATWLPKSENKSMFYALSVGLMF